jgi:hypothetical protein
MNIQQKKYFFFPNLFFRKLDMWAKIFNFRMHIGSKTPKICIFTCEILAGILRSEDFS